MFKDLPETYIIDFTFLYKFKILNEIQFFTYALFILAWKVTWIIIIELHYILYIHTNAYMHIYGVCVCVCNSNFESCIRIMWI